MRSFDQLVKAMESVIELKELMVAILVNPEVAMSTSEYFCHHKDKQKKAVWQRETNLNCNC